jgi:hypothetical protein
MTHQPDPYALYDRIWNIEEVVKRIAAALSVDVSDLYPEQTPVEVTPDV